MAKSPLVIFEKKTRLKSSTSTTFNAIILSYIINPFYPFPNKLKLTFVHRQIVMMGGGRVQHPVHHHDAAAAADAHAAAVMMMMMVATGRRRPRTNAGGAHHRGTGRRREKMRIVHRQRSADHVQFAVLYYSFFSVFFPVFFFLVVFDTLEEAIHGTDRWIFFSGVVFLL